MFNQIFSSESINLSESIYLHQLEGALKGTTTRTATLDHVEPSIPRQIYESDANSTAILI